MPAAFFLSDEFVFSPDAGLFLFTYATFIPHLFSKFLTDNPARSRHGNRRGAIYVHFSDYPDRSFTQLIASALPLETQQGSMAEIPPAKGYTVTFTRLMHGSRMNPNRKKRMYPRETKSTADIH